MKKIFFILATLFTLLFFSCDPCLGIIEVQEFATAKYVVDGVECDLILGKGFDINRNHYSIRDDIDEHTVIISLSINNAKVCNAGHINLDIPNEVEYNSLEAIEGNIKTIPGAKRIESISDEGYEKIKVKISWKGEFRSRLYLNFRDSMNYEQFSYITFYLINGKLPWQE